MFAGAKAGDIRLVNPLNQNTTYRASVSSRQQSRRRASAIAAPFESASDPKRVAVFVSGGGSNFKQIHKGCLNGSIKGEVVVRTSQLSDPVQAHSACQRRTWCA